MDNGNEANHERGGEAMDAAERCVVPLADIETVVAAGEETDEGASAREGEEEESLLLS